MTNALLATLTALVAFLMTLALLDQWRERRRTYQLVWAIGSLLFGIAAACEALGAAGGWNVGIFKAWYLTGAVLNVGWLGLGTAFLLAKTRFGYAYAFITALAGIFTVLSQVKNHYPDAGSVAILYLIFSLVLAIAVAGETYFQNERWPRIAATWKLRGDGVSGGPGKNAMACHAGTSRPRHEPAVACGAFA